MHDNRYLEKRTIDPNTDIIDDWYWKCLSCHIRFGISYDKNILGSPFSNFLMAKKQNDVILFSKGGFI